MHQSLVNQSSVILNPPTDDNITVLTSTSSISCTAQQFTAVTTTNVASNSTLVSMSDYLSPQISVPILTSTETKKSEVVNGMEAQKLATVHDTLNKCDLQSRPHIA